LPITNVRKPIKGSKDADFRLVFVKERNKKLPLEFETQSPMTSSKNL